MFTYNIHLHSLNLPTGNVTDQHLKIYPSSREPHFQEVLSFLRDLPPAKEQAYGMVFQTVGLLLELTQVRVAQAEIRCKFLPVGSLTSDGTSYLE